MNLTYYNFIEVESGAKGKLAIINSDKMNFYFVHWHGTDGMDEVSRETAQKIVSGPDYRIVGSNERIPYKRLILN